MHHLPEAEAARRRALQIREQVAAADPNDRTAAGSVGRSHCLLADILTEEEQWKAAAAEYRAGIAVLEPLKGPDLVPVLIDCMEGRKAVLPHLQRR